MTVRLGPFVLERPIARGGMAEVWRGVHEGEQVPVAVKVLTGPRARDAAFVGALKNEIHAVARLNHPGIILVYDRGTVDDDAERHSAGRLVAGSPWFAMEMCSHGALSPRRFPLPWLTSRTLLLSLLDALAHAHARGVVHRDLKPGNVLLSAPVDARPGLKISDFGIAQPLGIVGDEAARDAHSGTPRYMAPEQFNGAAREMGPWTDLYAVGCIAYQLAVGQAPFSGDALRLAVAHCHDPVPPFGDREERGYPAGYEAWVLRLLEKEPRDRYHAAADAAWGLLQLSADADLTLSSDWEGALHSLRPRPMFPDDDPSSRGTQGDDTNAHTIGPPKVGVEHPSMDYTPAPPPNDDESTGPMRVAVVGGPDTGRTDVVDDQAPPRSRHAEDPTALARRAAPSRLGMAPPTATGTGTGGQGWPETAPTGGRQDNKLVIDDDDPFAAVLGVDDDADRSLLDDDPKTDPRTWAPKAPWTELLEMKAAVDANDERADHDYPTIGGPFTAASEVAVARSERKDARVRAPATPPPSLASWRRPDDNALLTPSQQRLVGVGLGLYGMRQVPFVGRAAERDMLWDALASARGGSDEVVVVYGPAGVGRSRLVQWFGERAAEVGAASSMWAGHSPEPGPIDGLAGAMARALRLRLRPDEDVAALLRSTLRSLDDDDVQLIVGALHGAAVGKAAERHAAMARALRILSRRRPVVAILDDAQWGEDALAFATMIAERGADRGAEAAAVDRGREADAAHGLVVVVTVAEEAVAERPVASGLVDRLLENPRVRRVPLAPLPTKEHCQLVRELLGLEPRLAEMVVERTAGNPRYAVELVGDLVERGVLELHASGFGLQRGAVMALPASLHSMWSERLERMLQTLPAEARQALELGAVLGEDGDTAEWIAVCERAGLSGAGELVAALVDALERARFVTVDANQGGALRFAHAMLREAMTRLADEGGRLKAHHLIIAAHLDQRRRRGDDERRARHLFAGGKLDDALPVLFAAVHQTLAADGSARAAVLIDEAFSALDKEGVFDVDPRRLRAMALRARVLADAGRYDESEMWARLVKADVDDDVPRAARIDALRARALVAARKGDIERSVALYQDLLVLAGGDDEEEGGGDDGRHGDAVDDALMGLADGHYYQGRLADADVVLGQALTRMQTRGDLQAVALCLWNLAYVALWRGDPAAARECLLRAGKLARGQHLHTLLGLTRNALGDVERVAGLPDDARRHYEEARQALEKAGSGKVRTVEVNLALCAITTGHFDAAVGAAETILPLAARAGEAVLSSLCHGVLAVGAARANDWSVADAHLAAFLVSQNQGLVDGEHALLSETFAHLALKANDTWRAGVAISAARDVWAALGREDRLETLPEALPHLTLSSSSSSASSSTSSSPTSSFPMPPVTLPGDENP